MLGHIFYFLGLFLFLGNIILISNFFKTFKAKEWAFKFKKVTSKDPNKKDFQNKDYEYYSYYSAIGILNFFWMFFGILGNNWYIFLFIILINLIINFICKKIGEFNITSKILQLVRNITISMTIGFLVINHFHLHLNIWNLLVSRF